MRAIKIVGGAIAAVVLLAVLAALAVLWLVDPNDYRDDIEKLVADKTHRELKIGGPIDLKLFPWLALKLEDVSLGNPPGFGNQPFLTVKSASVGVKLLPLLSKRLEISRVAVDGLAANLISRDESTNNWKDLTESKSEKPAESGGASPTASIAGVDITKSALLYRDEAKDSTTRLANLELHTGALGGDEPVAVKGEFDFDQGEVRPLAHIALETKARLPKDTSRVEIKDLSVTGKWFGAPDKEAAAAAEKQEPLPISIKTPALTLDLSSEALAPTTLNVEVGKLLAHATVTGEKVLSNRVITGNITVPQVSPRDIMKSLAIEAPKTSDAAVLQKLSFKSDFRLTEKALKLPAMDLALDDTSVKGSFGIDDLDKMAMSFDLDVNAIDLDRYMEPKPKGDAKAPAAKAAEPAKPVELPIEALRKLIAKGMLRVGRAKVSDLQFTNVRLPLDANEGLVKLGPTQAQLFGGGYTGNIELDARPAQARLSLNEHVKDIDIGALMKASFDTNRLTGRGNASAVMTGTGNTDEAIIKSLAGKLQTDVRDGAFNGVDLWFELRRAWALIKRQSLPTRSSGPPRTVFKTLTANATLGNGVLKNDDLKVDIDYLKANGNGTLDLSSKAVDYRLVAEIYKLPPDGAGAEMAELKAVSIPINITGTVEDMKVRPDLEGLLKARVRKEVNDKVQEKKQEIKKKLGDRLKGLLGE
jgi:AsmA protein